MPSPKLALLHTGMVFIKVETMMDDLFAELMPDVERITHVDDLELSCQFHLRCRDRQRSDRGCP